VEISVITSFNPEHTGEHANPHTDQTQTQNLTPHPTPSHPKPLPLILIILIPQPLLLPPRPILPDRDLDALRREALAQLGALDDARELLRAVHLELVAEARRQHRRDAPVDLAALERRRRAAVRVWVGGDGGGAADVDEAEAESGGC
jgi:hypothetical protein